MGTIGQALKFSEKLQGGGGGDVKIRKKLTAIAVACKPRMQNLAISLSFINDPQVLPYVWVILMEEYTRVGGKLFIYQDGELKISEY